MAAEEQKTSIFFLDVKYKIQMIRVLYKKLSGSICPNHNVCLSQASDMRFDNRIHTQFILKFDKSVYTQVKEIRSKDISRVTTLYLRAHTIGRMVHSSYQLATIICGCSLCTLLTVRWALLNLAAVILLILLLNFFIKFILFQASMQYLACLIRGGVRAFFVKFFPFCGFMNLLSSH